MESVLNDLDAARKVVDEHLDDVSWLAQAKGRDFHPVGGAWRNLARIHMEQIGHPLHVIHEYAIERREAEDLARLVGRLSKRTLITIPGMSKRRAETLPFAALVLERILRTARPARILFSAHGLREGHIFDLLSPDEKARDPLIAACQELAQLDGRFGDTGELLDDWIAPLFKGDDARRLRLRRAACTLSDIGWREHPDYRAEQVFARIVRICRSAASTMSAASPSPDAVYARYGSDEPTMQMAKLLTMLSDEDREYWKRRRFGAAAGLLRQRRNARRTQGNRRPHGRRQDPAAAAQRAGGAVRRKCRTPLQRAGPRLRPRHRTLDRALRNLSQRVGNGGVGGDSDIEAGYPASPSGMILMPLPATVRPMRPA